MVFWPFLSCNSRDVRGDGKDGTRISLSCQDVCFLDEDLIAFSF